MQTFIKQVLEDLYLKQIDITNYTFVLPNKRAAVFLKQELANVVKKTAFLPEIISIETLTETLSGINTLNNVELLFEFYSAYKKVITKEQDSFEVFSTWAPTILQDFNEIDRYLIPSKQVFSYLKAIKELDHWSNTENATPLITNYLKFWNELEALYTTFKTQLLSKQKGYQGLIYREAINKLEVNTRTNNSLYVFIGFNALNTSEEKIIQYFLERKQAKIYWDIEHAFINQPYHSATYFIKQYLNNWNYYNNKTINWIQDNYIKKKAINIYGVPQKIGQVKHIATLLKDTYLAKKTLTNTALVLADETLLIPLLQALPKEITQGINITMGFPLKYTPLNQLFESLFKLHKTTNKYYYKDVIAVLNHPYITTLFPEKVKFVNHLNINNIRYIDYNFIKENTPNAPIIELLFKPWTLVEDAINNCKQLIKHLKLNLNYNRLIVEYLFRFNALFLQIETLNNSYNYINTLSSLQNVFYDILQNETLDFQGEPLEGLQIMGVLESRVLDFETVIIASVNEGKLPAGKTHNSFIPFDVKLEYKLPTYKEKDAIYAYHFYRLLHRAKNVHILYNTELDVLQGGEQSRFIRQLELENIHTINHSTIVPKVPAIKPSLIEIKKTTALIEAIKNYAKNGFSPSSLTNYIRNPIDFYYQNILKITQVNTVEETVAANTMGTVIHNTLEALYKPLERQHLSVTSIDRMLLNYQAFVLLEFNKCFKEGNITRGKNKLIHEAVNYYIKTFLLLEKNELLKGNTIKILGIELDLNTPLTIKALDFPIQLKGKIDRIDTYNNITRIIDYKSGNVTQTQVELVDWSTITTNYKKYSKSFQLLTYAYLATKNKIVNLPIETGIISFKNLKHGVLTFGKKDTERSKQKHQTITTETLIQFEQQLTQLIIDICNIDLPFIEKQITP